MGTILLLIGLAILLGVGSVVFVVGAFITALIVFILIAMAVLRFLKDHWKPAGAILATIVALISGLFLFLRWRNAPTFEDELAL